MPFLGSYIYGMDIKALSTGLSQQRVQQDVAIQVQKMAMDEDKTQADDLINGLEAARVITDPSLGNRVDMLA